MAFVNRLNARSVATLGAGKYNDGAGLLLHKCKDEALNGFIVIPFTGTVAKWAWVALRDVSF